MCPRLSIKEESTLGGCGTRTLASLLLGAVRVSLVTEAGVGARQVLASRIPTGVWLCALVYICKQSQPGQGRTGRSWTAVAVTGAMGQEQPRDRRVGMGGRHGGTVPSPRASSDGRPRDHVLLIPHLVHCRCHCSGPTTQGRCLNLLLKCGSYVPRPRPGTRATRRGPLFLE